MSLRPRASLAAAAMAISLLATSCGSSDASACGEVERVIDASSLHVLPGAEISYEHSPPAGGPHQLPGPRAGIHTDAIDEPLQVAAIESGKVIIQYQKTLDDASVQALEALAGREGVIVAPGHRPFDEDARVAHTSWGRRQLCTGADPDTARAFIDAYLGAVFIDHTDTDTDQ